ncbi:MAG: hypothetical protein R2861_02960 [Desulfobacterales bacterium]
MIISWRPWMKLNPALLISTNMQVDTFFIKAIDESERGHYFSERTPDGSQKSFPVNLGCGPYLMGVGVFFRVPVVVEKMAGAFDTNAGLYFFRFSFYLIAVILIGGG